MCGFLLLQDVWECILELGYRLVCFIVRDSLKTLVVAIVIVMVVDWQSSKKFFELDHYANVTVIGKWILKPFPGVIYIS